MAEESAPVQFGAVGGHASSMFYGAAARDGRSTLQKKTTAWEVMYYLAMELATEEVFLSRPHTEGDEARTKFVHAAGQLASFAPALFSIRFPDKYVPKSEALRTHLEQADEWVVVEAGAPARQSILAPLFHELYDGAEQLKGFDDVYDTSLWGIGLVDETSGMERPCVMDVKIGYIRHSPLTPEEKVARMMKKEHNSLMRHTALRICGCQRYTETEAGTACERFGKNIGYAVSTVTELSTCLKVFLSVGQPLAEATEDGQVKFRPEVVDRISDVERAQMQQRICAVRADLRALLNFVENTPDGVFMMQHVAFVSASVLLLYDAAASPATARLCFIDFARSTWRKFNFNEQAVGFVQGLKNLDTYLT
ncbi:Inositol polyphosphate kinase [Novymonas esmeraldas]|uniref:Kinase n=1 Tax=Novymonas esmeraldas TaxID=1808958 RepID=A0AAW0F8H0_9TRYP